MLFFYPVIWGKFEEALIRFMGISGACFPPMPPKTAENEALLRDDGG